jgi:hypothetical protein
MVTDETVMVTDVAVVEMAVVAMVIDDGPRLNNMTGMSPDGKGVAELHLLVDGLIMNSSSIVSTGHNLITDIMF